MPWEIPDGVDAVLERENSLKAFVGSKKNGAYTCFRGVHDLDFHVRRLSFTGCDPHRVKRAVLGGIARFSTHASADALYAFVVRRSQDEDWIIDAYMTNSIKLSTDPVNLVCASRPFRRTNPNLKSTDWIAERESLKAPSSSEAESWCLDSSPIEHVLWEFGDDGDVRLLEGFTSTLCALVVDEDGSFAITSPTEGGVLESSTLVAAFRACARVGLRCARQDLSLTRRDAWAGLFIVNANRSLCPVRRLVVSRDEILEFPRDDEEANALIRALRAAMLHDAA